MITFLPYSDFELCAKCLDDRRLGKQRLETFDILVNNNLEKITPEIIHYRLPIKRQTGPAFEMWSNYSPALVAYGIAICKEWIDRGFKDTTINRISSFGTLYPGLAFMQSYLTKYAPKEIPYWLGDPQLHMSHKSNLLRKLPEWYTKFWICPMDMPYFWPRNNDTTN